MCGNEGHGIQPVSSTKAFEIYRTLEQLKSYRDEKQSELANRYVAAMRKENEKEMVAVRRGNGLESASCHRRQIRNEDRPERCNQIQAESHQAHEADARACQGAMGRVRDVDYGKIVEINGSINGYDLERVLKWRPQPDLNRCCRRERPVSWTGLDDGDEEQLGL